MATIPRGATLIDNPVSVAPGFTIGNVHVMAGVPRIMQAMFETLAPRLRGGVPVASRHLQGVDSLHSIVQMPKGIPVATFAIGVAGAANAALFAVAMLANDDPALRAKLDAYRTRQTEVARAMSADLK